MKLKSDLVLSSDLTYEWLFRLVSSFFNGWGISNPWKLSGHCRDIYCCDHTRLFGTKTITYICGQYLADCKQRMRWGTWRTTSLILCFIVNVAGIKKESSLTESTKIKLKQNLLRISQQNNFPFENVYLKKTKCICFGMQFFWINEEFLIKPWLHALEWAMTPYRDTELKFACFTFKLCRPLGLQPQSLLSEAWWAFFYLHGSFSSW